VREQIKKKRPGREGKKRGDREKRGEGKNQQIKSRSRDRAKKIKFNHMKPKNKFTKKKNESKKGKKKTRHANDTKKKMKQKNNVGTSGDKSGAVVEARRKQNFRNVVVKVETTRRRCNMGGPTALRNSY